MEGGEAEADEMGGTRAGLNFFFSIFYINFL